MGACSTPPYGVEGFGSQHAKGPRATRTPVSPGGNLRTTITGLLITDEWLSQCLFILANSLPPPNAWTSSEGSHLCGYFGLTFRVSLRFISLFSSISSCSLRAAENEMISVALRVQTHANSVYEMFGNYWEENKHIICIICLIRFTPNSRSFLKPKIVSIIGCLILLGMGIWGQWSLCSFQVVSGLFGLCLRTSAWPL